MFVLAVLVLPTTGYFLIRQHKVQSYLIHKITTKLTDYLGAPITISAATIDLFSNIILRDFCVRTPQNDTILYTPELKIQFNNLTLSSKHLEFNKITMIQPDINFYIDSTRNINFLFILKKLGLTDTTKSANPMVVSIDEIILKNADFSLKAFNQIRRDSCINFTDLHLKPLNIRVVNFRSDHGVSMKIKELSAVEKSGFVLEKFSSQLKINKMNMVYNNLSIQTPQSQIHAEQVLFNFNSFKDFKPGIFGKNVNLNIALKPSDISSDDIAWFAPVLKHYNLKARISGNLRGRFNDLKGRDIDILYGQHTHFKGNIDISGLPKFGSSFLHVDIKNLYTTPSDIESINLPKSKNGKIKLPEQFKQFTFLTYHGKFTGFINDFVAYGTITSNLGNIISDLSLRPDTANDLSFKGQIKADQFNFGQFINRTDLFGKITLNAMVNGHIGGTKDIEAKCDGTVNSFVINNYNYQNIKINGTLVNKTYDGSVSISDPNINCDFLGQVNLSNHIPVFNFKANVKSAKLYKLNIDRKDTSSFVSFYATADFDGNSIDNLNGEIKLWNFTLRRSDKKIQISNFLLFTKNVNDTNRIILQSELADAEIWGTYQFKELVGSFKTLACHYLPALSKNQFLANASSNNFKFEVNCKNTRQLTDFFVPGFYISKDSKLTGTYNPSKNDFNFLMNIPLLQHKSKKWYNVYVNGKTSKGDFSLISGCSTLRINNKLNLDNFTLLSDIRHDSIDLRIRWNNFDTITNKGNLAIIASLKAAPDHPMPIVKLFVKPSQIVLQDSAWQLQSGLVEIDSSEIKINQFFISHLNQSIKIFGDISKQTDQPLSFELHDINLSNLDTLLSSKKIYVAGIINGKAELFDLYHNPIFRASLILDSLSINSQPFGRTTVSALYDNSDKNIDIDAFSERGSIKTLNIKGTYATQSKMLDFNIDLNKLKLDVFQPYLATIFSDVRGIATGSLALSGTPQAPVLNGSVKAQKASFVVNYLKTRYNFTQKVEINKNTFLLKDIEVFDSKGNKAMVNGEIEYRNLKELLIDSITIDAQKFECLNTTEKDNTMFFGQAFATGSVLINGTPKNMKMEIDATTDPNTSISIPMGTKNELAESKFIRFVNKKQAKIPLNQYEIDKTNDHKKPDISSSALKLDFDLHVTPDAEVQIIFDPKIGDIIKGNGSGNLNMTYEGGDFNMYGTYTIEKGQYLFTLGNFINKRLDIEQGTLTWNGNPLDATINIQAKYGLNTSLYPLGMGVSEEYKKRIRVECRLFLTDKLMNPKIQYDIYLPNTDQETRNLVNNVINTDEELSKQFIWLLVWNSFTPPSNSSGYASTNIANSSSGYNAAGVTGLEFLSNQFSRILSQFSKDFDIGFNYRYGDQITTDQVEVAMSTQLLNDKVTINGNVDVGGKQVTSNTSNLTGAGNVDLKLTKNGKLRLKAFNRSNESYISEISPYTQGVGVSYKEGFNSFTDLIKHYYRLLFTRKEHTTIPVEEKTKNDDKGTETDNE